MKIIGLVHDNKLNTNSFMPNFTNILTLFILIDTLTLADTIYFPKSEILNKILKVHSAKSLRKELINHIQYVENIIKHLDEWAFTEIKEITNNEELTELKIQWLQNQINKTTVEIKELIVDLAENNYNITYIKDRYNNLQIVMIKITNLLNENTINSFRLFKEYLGDEFPNFVAAHEYLMYRMTVLLKQIEIKEEIVLREACIQAIRNNDYEDAINKLDQINDDNVINDIIREVYDNNENHFTLLLKFGDKISNKTKSFLVYRVLIYEMEISGQNNDSYRIIETIKSIKNEVIHPLNTPENIKTEAIALVEYLMKKLKHINVENLKRTILNGTYYSENVPIFNEIFNIDGKLFSEISIEALIVLFNDHSIRALYGWIMESFTDVFDRIFNNNSNDENSFKLAYYIDDLLKLANDQSIESAEQNFTDILYKNMKFFINRLSESIRNIVFNKKVCIKHVHLNQYLYTTDDTIANSKFKVFTGYLNQSYTNSEQLWHMKHSYGNVYDIQSIAQNYTYLYTADIYGNDELKSKEHNVYTWSLLDDQITKRLGIWQIIPVGHYCYIKNVLHHEYLYASEDSSHNVFTVNNNNSVENDNHFKWHIVDCLG